MNLSHHSTTIASTAAPGITPHLYSASPRYRHRQCVSVGASWLCPASPTQQSRNAKKTVDVFRDIKSQNIGCTTHAHSRHHCVRNIHPPSSRGKIVRSSPPHTSCHFSPWLRREKTAPQRRQTLQQVGCTRDSCSLVA